jgi:maleylacetoacetate isomerase
MKLKLYHYWRSSCSWRVRWALHYKKIECELIHINLLSGEAQSPSHLEKNPQGYVPALEISELHYKLFLSESLPIIEWLEESFPDTPSLLPGNTFERAKIRQLAEVINSGTQPIQNLSVMNAHSENPDEKKRWAQKWIKKGLLSYEKILGETSGEYSVGDQLTLADLCLIPQVYNANRFEVDITDCPKICAIDKKARTTTSYLSSEPSRFEVK